MVTQFPGRTVPSSSDPDVGEQPLRAALADQDAMLGAVEGLLSRMQAHFARATDRLGFDWREHCLRMDVERTLDGVSMLRARTLPCVTDQGQGRR